MHSAYVRREGLAALLPGLAELAEEAVARQPLNRILVFQAAYKTPSALDSYDGAFMVMAYARWKGEDADAQREAVAWTARAEALLKPHSLGAYVNESMHDRAGSAAACYSDEALSRLRAAKGKYDPWGLLRSL